MSSTQQGYLLVADITGYTAYLSESELEHAHDVLQKLLELLIEHTLPPLVISRLAGDAVISYGLRDQFLSGQTFVEMLEDTYVSFRKAINLMVLNTSCRCNACANISSLDLKFFVHYGAFALQHLGEHDELLGSDVNLIHRLLKNNVREQTGVHAYSLYTAAAVRQLGIEELAQTMTPHSERYEHVGEVETYVQDMHPVWQEKQKQAQITIPEGQWLVRTELDTPLDLHQAWDVITDPDYRASLFHSERQEVHHAEPGRLGRGGVYECYHGGGRITRQIILEWLPFEQLTTEDTTPFPGATVLTETRLTPLADGTRITITCSKARGPWPSRTLLNLLGPFMMPRVVNAGKETLQAQLEQEIAEGKHALPAAA